MMSRMTGVAAGCASMFMATALAHAGEPALTGSFGWEDGQSTILGGNFPNNVTASNISDLVNTGIYALKLTESPHVAGTPHVYVAHIRNLQDGDLVRAGFWTFDNVPGAAPRVRIWAHYTLGENIAHLAQAGGNNDYSQGIGWEELTHQWTFDSNKGQRDGLVIQVRLYSPACPAGELCATDYWVDDLWVEVYGAEHPDLEIILPDHSQDPKGPRPCEPSVVGDYGWEDGEDAVLGANSPALIFAENVADFVFAGDHALRVTQAPNTPGSPVHVYLAHVQGLQPGDVITARLWTYDEAPGELPYVRLWAHYTDGESIGPINQAGGNSQQSAGIGWEELSHTWEFGENPNWGGFVIQARLFTPQCDGDDPAACFTDFHFDDLSIDICAAEPDAVSVLFPDAVRPAPQLCPDPDLVSAYGWEDEEGTFIGGTFLSSLEPMNVDDFTHTGVRALRVTESPHASGTPEVWLAQVRNLQHGDIVDARLWTYDAAPLSMPRVRVWAHYTQGESVNSVGTAGGNTTYSLGIGWEEIGHGWVFDSAGGTRDGLVILARLYSPDCTQDDVCATDYWFDDMTVSVCAADAGEVFIIFPDEFEPKIPDPPPACNDPPVMSSYDWEDGEGTIIGGTLLSSLAALNNDDPDFVYTGTRSLKVTESPHASATPQVWLAHIRNLQDGDVVDASFWTFDNEPGTPRVRIWAHYTSGSSPAPVPQGSAGGPSTYSSGIGWEKISHAWEFDSAGGTRDGLVIQGRLYSAACPDGEVCATDYWFDDLTVNVCTPTPQNIVLFFPDSLAPEPPVEMCRDPMWGEYGWEDGRSTYIGAPSSSISGSPTTELVNSGSYALRVTNFPSNVGMKEVFLAYVEHLQHSDTIRASFFAFDDTPGVHPRVRIWGRYGHAGQTQFLLQSAGGNEQWTSGIGWEELEHTWEFDAGAAEPPRNALMVIARLYPPPCNEEAIGWDPVTETCTTHFYIDDLLVEACGEHPNLTITFPDGAVIGDPDPAACAPDVNRSGSVGLFDLLSVLGAWGTADGNADVNGDGIVDGADVGIVIASFGSCADVLPPLPGVATLTLDDAPAAGGLRRYDLHVELDPDDALVNVYDANITSSLGFAGGSFITIGSNVAHFDIAEDPNFDFTAFTSGTSLGANGGWYNFSPGNNLGLAGLYDRNRVLICRFFVDDGTEFNAELSVTYEDASGRPRQVALTIERDVPACPGDLTGSGGVGVADLLQLLSCWGPVGSGGGSGCEAADLTGNGAVGVADLLELLSNWGPCP